MTRERTILRDILVRELPLEFVESLLVDIPQAYREAAQSMKLDGLLDDPERMYLHPHYRRVLIEKKFRDRAREAGLTATVESNAPDTAQYSLVKTGTIGLTHSKTDSRKAVPPLADFRSQRADANNMLVQDDMFPFEIEEETDAETYAILVHGPLQKDEDNPDVVSEKVDFIAIGFPAPSRRCWLEEPIDLREVRDRIAANEQIEKDKLTAAVRRSASAPMLKRKLGQEANIETARRKGGER